MIDAEIDADRIDFVQRDGLLAGGEYGHMILEDYVIQCLLSKMKTAG